MSYADLLANKRAELQARGKHLCDAATAERRDMNSTEHAEFDAIIAQLGDLKDAGVSLAQRDAGRAGTEAAMRALADQPHDPASGWQRRGAAGVSVDPELNKRFREAIASRSTAPIEVFPSGADLRSGYSPGIERRSLATTSGSGLVGTTFYSTLQRHLVENSAILAAGATLINSSSGETLKVPKSTANSSASIVAEAGAIPASDPTLGSASLGAFKYGFLVQISHELYEDSSFDVASYLAAQAGTALANGAGAHFMAGTGGGTQPAGLLSATTLGVTGGLGVGGAPTADNLIDLYHSLAAPYARSAGAAWFMRNSTLAVVRKLKDTQNRYLFDINAPLGSGADGTLLGRPVYVDPNVPAIGLGAKSITFGAVDRYWVRAVNGVRFEQSLDYAFGNDLITFRALWRADGVLVDQTGAVKHFAGGAS